jgi:hypothetical protein
MTTTSRSDAKAKARIRARDIRHGLTVFQERRNTVVHFRLLMSSSASEVMDSVNHHSEVTTLQGALFSVFINEAERKEILREAYMVGTSLMTDVECATEELEGHRYVYTGESKAVLESKVKAAATSFEGVASLQALALMCGYSVDEVTSLNADEVAEAFTFVAKFWVMLFEKQLSWTDLMEFMRIDIDPSLVNDFLGGHDDYPSVS